MSRNNFFNAEYQYSRDLNRWEIAAAHRKELDQKNGVLSSPPSPEQLEAAIDTLGSQTADHGTRRTGHFDDILDSPIEDH